MPAPDDLIRQQLAESARVKQSFSPQLIAGIATFAEKSAQALSAGALELLLWPNDLASDGQF